jgi:hypothetical protein
MNYLETVPLNTIAKYTDGPPKDTVPFTGYTRQHPSDKSKLILIYDPLGKTPTVMELKLEDILYAEELHSAVSESGEGVPLVKIWVRRGAHGVILEPFEVQDPIHFANNSKDLRKT